MSLGVFSQISWYGVGDIDECWIIATYWALVATGVMTREQLPSIAEFREAAGRPDKPGASGGNNYVIMKALKTMAPDADASLFIGGMANFTKQLKLGYVASLSVLSGALPAYLRFGFSGAHQVSVYYKAGKFYVANPLAKEGSGLLQISAADLAKAAGALFGDGLLHAVLIKAGEVKPPKSYMKHIPQRPRDLAAPIIVRDYIDPLAAKRAYDGRHKRRG
jgi:hypothetical protein